MLQVDEQDSSDFLVDRPSTVVKSMRKLERFREFINQATPAELRTLIPAGYKIYKKGLREEVLKHFKKQGVNPSDNLLASAASFSEASNLSDKDYTKIWAPATSHNSNADRTDDFKRLCGIMRGIDTFENNIEVAGCALRISLLLLSHQVEQITAKVPRHMLGPGVGKRTVALQQLAQQYKEDVGKIKWRLRRSARYVLIAKKGGIGTLLMMGSQVSSFETLTDESVEKLCNYRKNYLPALQTRCEQLNEVAAQVVIEGFWRYGWNYEDLSNDESDLMALIGPYIDLGLLTSGHIVLRRQPQFSAGILREIDASMAQPSETSHNGHDPPAAKRRKVLLEASQVLERAPSLESAFVARACEDGTDRAVSRAPSIDTGGSGAIEETRQGVEARPQHTGRADDLPSLSHRACVTLLPEWPPRWTSLNVPNSNANYSQEMRELLPHSARSQEQIQICSSPESRAPVSNIEIYNVVTSRPDMVGEVSESQQRGHVTRTTPEVHVDSAPPMQTTDDQCLVAPSSLVNDILRLDPETVATMDMLNSLY